MLEGKQINLRLFRAEDLEEFLALESKCTERGAYYPISLHPLPVAQKHLNETGWWEEHAGRMLVTDKQGRLLGTVFFFQGCPFGSGYEIGYLILRPEDRGKGYMSEALRIFSAYLFALKPIPRLYLRLSVGNAASRRIAEKCGYQHEGTQRKYMFIQGEYQDCELFSLLREECPPLAEVLP